MIEIWLFFTIILHILKHMPKLAKKVTYHLHQYDVLCNMEKKFKYTYQRETNWKNLLYDHNHISIILKNSSHILDFLQNKTASNSNLVI